jgi:CDP-diglyceride synthetase
LSVLLAAILVIIIFLTALFQWEIAILLSGLFIACMLSLIGSLVAFIQDLNLSLDAYQYDIKDVVGKKPFKSD